MIYLIVLAVVLAFVLILLANSVRVLREYERGVVFRLGRLLGDPKGPGLFLLIPIVDKMIKVELRVVTLVIPPQEVRRLLEETLRTSDEFHLLNGAKRVAYRGTSDSFLDWIVHGRTRND